MKENLPELKDIMTKSESMQDFGIMLLMLFSIGYTMDDFQAYVDESMADPHTQKAIEILAPLTELAFVSNVKEN